MYYVSSAQILSRLCAAVCTVPTDVACPRKGQGFAAARIHIGEEVFWRALGVLAGGPLQVAVI